MLDVFSIIVIINIVETLKNCDTRITVVQLLIVHSHFLCWNCCIVVLSFHTLQFSPVLLSSYSLSMHLLGGHK